MRKKEKPICGIYKITNRINGKSYIGQSVNIKKRWSNHRSKWSAKNNPTMILYKAFEKHGIENFDFEIIEECDKSKLDILEIHYVSKFKSYINGYNSTPGGVSFKGCEDYYTYIKQKLIKKYTKDYYDIYEKSKPKYVLILDGDIEFIYTKTMLNRKKSKYKRNGKIIEFDKDYFLFNECNNLHNYELLARIIMDLKEDLATVEYYYTFEKEYSEEEFNDIVTNLHFNIESAEDELRLISFTEEESELDIELSSTHYDWIYDLIPDYDELGGDEYFNACFF